MASSAMLFRDVTLPTFIVDALCNALWLARFRYNKTIGAIPRKLKTFNVGLADRCSTGLAGITSRGSRTFEGDELEFDSSF
jgi:hypothetical protein